MAGSLADFPQYMASTTKPCLPTMLLSPCSSQALPPSLHHTACLPLHYHLRADWTVRGSRGIDERARLAYCGLGLKIPILERVTIGCTEGVATSGAVGGASTEGIDEELGGSVGCKFAEEVVVTSSENNRATSLEAESGAPMQEIVLEFVNCFLFLRVYGCNLLHNIGVTSSTIRTIAPPKMSTSESGATVNNPDYISWVRTDRLVKSWIVGTLSEEVLGHTVSLQTAAEALEVLWNFDHVVPIELRGFSVLK
uniref:Uncharacterized protein n=1 Tax=Ananas comosus var. bracteatus TaxID=296719 RepID=A0A6V7QHD7_ANACO|nr:unnamed protein product [Ananas comosus var. bracteatus]